MDKSLIINLNEILIITILLIYDYSTKSAQNQSQKNPPPWHKFYNNQICIFKISKN